jgi:hypothetical protein
METEMLTLLKDCKMLQALLDNVPSHLLPVEIVSGNGIVYTLAVLEVSRYKLDFDCIDSVSEDILDTENINRYCPVNDHANVVKLPHVTERWNIDAEGYTKWVITMYILNSEG